MFRSLLIKFGLNMSINDHKVIKNNLELKFMKKTLTNHVTTLPVFVVHDQKGHKHTGALIRM